MQDTKVSKLFALMKRGWVDPIKARDKCGIVNCLSQRANEFGKTAEAHGLKLIKKWVKDKQGRNVCKAYRLVRG